MGKPQSITLDTLGGTDEWDDDVLLHEFGHYVMNFYAEIPNSDTGGHAWPISYPERPGLAYGEGWAEFFSCRVRVGSGTDSLIVNTAKGIGGNSVYLWHNIENPWHGEFDSIWFMGGPWCEGAVAGALWDIYDSHNEIPYPSYPWPGFPDTALADTLTMGFDEIWNVFDDYDPAGTPTNCWTIFHFRSGWNSYNYGHTIALNQILLHHRIRDSIPGAPTGLQLFLENSDVRLYWHKNPEPDLQGYRVYRRRKAFNQLWTDWLMFAERPSPSDTTYLDTSVLQSYTYQYKLTAFDSLGNESDFSDSVSIALGLQEMIDIPNGTGFNNAPRIVRFLNSGRGYELLLAFSSEDNVKFVSSSNEGVTWSQSQVIGQGQSPTLFLDAQGNPCCLFGRWIGETGFGSAQLYYTKFINNHWTTPYRIFSVDSVYIGVPKLAIPAPSACVDSLDTVHVTWTSPMGKEYLHRFGVWYGKFYAPDTNPSFYYLQLDTIWVYEATPCPTLALDRQRRIHICYERGLAASDLYYRYCEDGIWREKELIESQGCYYPNLEYYGDRLNLVWDYQYPDTTIAHALHYRSRIGANWDTIMNVYKPLPFYRFCTPVNRTGWYTIWADQDIYYSRFNGASWGIPETVHVTPEISAYPTALFRQDLSDTSLYIAWTEGDSSPYHIEFAKITVPAVPKYYGDLGQPVQSQYCLQRDGYWKFGSEPYKTTDWGYNNLKYKFTGLDPQKEYRLDFSCYFENQPFEGNLGQLEAERELREIKGNQGISGVDNYGTEVPTPKKSETDDEPRGIGRIIQALLVDGVDLDTLFITPNHLRRNSVWLPEQTYLDCEIIVEFRKIKGKRVVCSEIGICEFPKEQSKIKSYAGPMGKEEAMNLPFFIEQVYPNPTPRIFYFFNPKLFSGWISSLETIHSASLISSGI